MELINLKSLVGIHTLNGIDFSIPSQYKKGTYFDDASTCSFILDNIVYQAIEDPSDGYRSSLDGIVILERDVELIIKKLPSPIVINCNYIHNIDVFDGLVFEDVISDLEILRIGTENFDYYYPTFVCSWNPKNLCVNIE